MKGFKRLAETDFVFQNFQDIYEGILVQNEKKISDFGSSAYLGLSSDINDEDLQLTKKWGLRNHWSRISGNNQVTKQLEIDLEHALRIDHVRLAQSISLINLTIFHSFKKLINKFIIDKDSHITLKMGVQAAVDKTRIKYFENNNLAELETRLKENMSELPNLISIDGVYSMKGNLAPVKEILELCRKYNAYVYIDDAHGFGVIGSRGFGVIDDLSTKELERVIYVGSFSKCASNPVGFIGAPEKFINNIDCYAPCLIYSGPPSNLHTIISTRHLKKFQNEVMQEKRNKLASISRDIHDFCFKNNIRVLSSPEFPMLAISIQEEHLEQIINGLKLDGIFAKPAIYPIVRKGDEIIRFTFMATHTEKEIKKLKDSIIKVKDLLRPRMLN